MKKDVKIGSVWATASVTSHGVVFRKMGFVKHTVKNLYGVLFNAEAPETGLLVVFCVVFAIADIAIPFVFCGA